MKELHTIEQVQEKKNASKPTVFLWSAKWCPDCVYLVPFLDSIEKENPDYDFYKLDRDELMDEAVEQEILGIPSFTVWKDGKETGRLVSKLRKTPAEIHEFLEGAKED